MSASDKALIYACLGCSNVGQLAKEPLNNYYACKYDVKNSLKILIYYL